MKQENEDFVLEIEGQYKYHHEIVVVAKRVEDQEEWTQCHVCKDSGNNKINPNPFIFF